MNGLSNFLSRQLAGKHFWYLFTANFTVFMMLAWRYHERDMIFKDAAAKFNRRY